MRDFISGAECREDTTNPNGYKCLCPVGYGGTHCAVQIDPCSGTTCYNGGTCVFKNGFTKPVCSCLEEFSGEFCQISSDPCGGVVCRNGGTCKASPMYNGFICFCAIGYHGEFCESEMNPCESSPCKNGGKCKNYVSSFLCICDEKHSGKYCERMKDMTQNDDTRNEQLETELDESAADVRSGSSHRISSNVFTLFVLSVTHISVIV